MATLAETVTRICDDLSRPEAEIGDAVRREVISAIEYYAKERLRFNEVELGFTISATTNYSLAAIVAVNPDVPNLAGILGVDDPVKLRFSTHEWVVPVITRAEWRRRDLANSAAGWPQIASVFAQQITIWPMPNIIAEAFITAHVEFALPTTEGDSPWLNEADRLIRAHAMAMVCANKLDDYEKAQVQRTIAEVAFAELRDKSALQLATGVLHPHW